jgi:hypothetical protein
VAIECACRDLLAAVPSLIDKYDYEKVQDRL